MMTRVDAGGVRDLLTRARTKARLGVELVVLLCWTAACVASLELEGAACPCAKGFACVDSTCVRTTEILESHDGGPRSLAGDNAGSGTADPIDDDSDAGFDDAGNPACPGRSCLCHGHRCDGQDQ